MKLKNFVGQATVAIGLLFGSPVLSASIDAAIYVGNDATFGADANDPGSLQGYTDIVGLWNSLGANAATQSTLDTTGQEVIVVSNPTTNLSGGDVAALTSFVNNGGLLVLTHNGTVSGLNALTAGMGSAMSFSNTLTGSGGTVVDNASPFMAGLDIGDTLNSFVPGAILGAGLQVLVEDSLGDALIATESFGLGTILGVADFDILNNVATDFFGAGAAQDNVLQFQANIVGGPMVAPVPLPGSLPLLGAAFGVAFVVRRQKAKN